jgi:pilus assembly protein CpaB
MNRRFLFVAILLAALAFVLVYVKIADTGGSSSNSSTAVGDQQVVVAKVPIKERTTITADMLDVKSVPLNSVATGAFTDPTAVLGKVTKFPVQANQQVLTSSVVDTARPTLGATLAGVVPTGQRGYSIPASQVSNAGGLILPGDWVDVVWLCCDNAPIISKTVLKNIQVVAVAQEIVSSGPVGSSTPTGGTGAGGTGSTNPIAASAAKPDPGAGSVTVLLNPDQVQLLNLAESSGKLRLDLRGPGDTDLPATAPTLINQLLPIDDLNGLPNELKPEGYKR